MNESGKLIDVWHTKWTQCDTYTVRDNRSANAIDFSGNFRSFFSSASCQSSTIMIMDPTDLEESNEYLIDPNTLSDFFSFIHSFIDCCKAGEYRQKCIEKLVVVRHSWSGRNRLYHFSNSFLLLVESVFSKISTRSKNWEKILPTYPILNWLCSKWPLSAITFKSIKHTHSECIFWNMKKWFFFIKRKIIK